jgi:hypothetical protein
VRSLLQEHGKIFHQMIWKTNCIKFDIIVNQHPLLLLTTNEKYLLDTSLVAGYLLDRKKAIGIVSSLIFALRLIQIAYESGGVLPPLYPLNPSNVLHRCSSCYHPLSYLHFSYPLSLSSCSRHWEPNERPGE